MAVTAFACAAVFAAGVVAAIDLVDQQVDHPDQWDERVVDLVTFVEEERDLEFQHPVYIDFLTAEEFTDVTTTDAADLTEKDLAELDDVMGLYRAVGLIEGDFDLLQSVNSLSDEGTLAYYDFEEQRITVRGTEMSPALAATLVHEISHALQDQHFDLGRMDSMSAEQANAFRGLVEGDAQRVENAYIDAMPDAEFDEYRSELQATLRSVSDSLQTVPEALSAFSASPYVFGGPFALAVEGARGSDGLDDAMKNPPRTSFELMSPLRFLETPAIAEVVLTEAPENVDVIELAGPGETTADFGAIDMYLMLAQRIDPLAALKMSAGTHDQESLVTLVQESMMSC